MTRILAWNRAAGLGAFVLSHGASVVLGTLRLHHAQTVPTGQPELRMAVYAPADEATRAALATL